MIKSSHISSKDVAKAAGVSQATVSYVLNNVAGVKIKPETRELVLATAKRLNYHPNVIARSMRLKRSMSIGIVSDKNVSNFNFMKTLEGIKDALLPQNYSITLCFERSAEIETAEHIRYYNSNRIDGIIFALAHLADDHHAYLVQHNIPFVVIHPNLKAEMANLVKTELDSAIDAAVASLTRKGIHEIAFWGTGAGDPSDRRFRGYCKALARHQLTLNEQILLKTLPGEEGLTDAFDQYLNEYGHLPRAVLCETPTIGFHLLRYASLHQIAVPRETAVIAIGTSRFSALSAPALSAIESPLYDMGFTGCEMLFDIMNGNLQQHLVVLEWSLVERESS